MDTGVNVKAGHKHIHSIDIKRNIIGHDQIWYIAVQSRMPQLSKGPLGLSRKTGDLGI